MSDVELFRVGALYDLWFAARSLHPRLPLTIVHRRLGVARSWRSLRRNWRRRSYWNGWLAEPRSGGFSYCGYGWTRSRAIRRLLAQVAAQ